MKPKRLVTGGIVALVTVLMATVFHEILHLVVNFAVTGRFNNCSTGFPINVEFGYFGFPTIYTCIVPGGVPGVNQLLSVGGVIALGLVLVWKSRTIFDPGVKWGIFVAGVFLWGWYSIYMLGIVRMPIFSGTMASVTHDGKVIIETFGIAPGIISVLVGSIVVAYRIQTFSIRRISWDKE